MSPFFPNLYHQINLIRNWNFYYNAISSKSLNRKNLAHNMAGRDSGNISQAPKQLWKGESIDGWKYELPIDNCYRNFHIFLKKSHGILCYSWIHILIFRKTHEMESNTTISRNSYPWEGREVLTSYFSWNPKLWSECVKMLTFV